MSPTRHAAILAAFALILPGCEEKERPAPAPKPAPKAAAPPAPAGAETAGLPGGFAIQGLNFKTPEGWTRIQPTSSMRLAELHAPGGAAAVFSTAGGDIQANIQRWSGQFAGAEAASSQRTVAGLTVHTVDIAGTYSGMNEAPREGWALHGAIIETSGQPIFVKMTGPADAVRAAAPVFDAMIEGMTR
jgi:hypothetical protein